MLRIIVLGIAGVFALTGISCVKISGGTWMVKSAPLPQGWPELSPVGEVVVRAYPEYRAAVVTDEAAEASSSDERMRPMFMELFEHIKNRDIAMTAPVEMGYADSQEADSSQMRSMAFLYRTPALGQAGDDGSVRVRDVEAQLVASTGVRGDYTDANFERGLAVVRDWLAHRAAEYEVIGPPRYLGYNGPFTPSPMRYGEVQIPVRRTAEGSDSQAMAAAE